MSGYTEDSLVEQPAIALFGDLAWETAKCFYETFGPAGTFGGETSCDVILERRLRPAFKNPFGIHPHLYPLPEGEDGTSEEALNLAVEEIN
jgi:type I restriction enzyme, R subunit